MNLLRTRRPRAVAISLGVLVTSAVGLGVVLAGCGSFNGGGVVSTVGAVRFETPLAIPPLAPSTINARGEREFELVAQQGSHHFGAASSTNNESTATWGFNQHYLGPTLVATRGEAVRITVENQLPEPTSVHWHGMHLPAKMDGGPHQPIAESAVWSPTWTIDQPAATLWYHPHLHGETEEHVTRGLAGMFLLRDEVEGSLALPREYGVDDVPVIVQDIRVGDDGSLHTDVRGFGGLLGDQIAVNGTVGPYVDVTTDLVRLRILNASPARVYRFGMADDRELALIATDGGLLEAPYLTSAVQLSPGERAEVVVRMTPGETVALRSSPPDLGVNNAAGNGGSDAFDVLELRAAPTLESRAQVPDVLAPIERLGPATVERTFRFDGMNINNEPMKMSHINETVTLGTTEVWAVRNEQSQPHSFHVHDVQFQVQSVDGSAPGAELSGWKDTIYLRPGVDYRLVMQFTDYSDPNVPYMYHCHLLWHEDRGMMGQFVVVRKGERAGEPPGDHEH
jgi:suppressor of ftsI